ncbi:MULTISPECIES: cytochrome C oxidase subunit IV family protein [Paenibacillus]|uniref:cytochrome C oxidase subunit IV family protein n=1 Tax=Paenibacillus TaxID=44249 RepID=UPI0003902E7C|nr:MULTISPECIES: cytochrome C oxidase subunit IV family protein [Paenibacillus]KKC49098.1 cytochrome C oxidase subunit IV [Paenibacillus sp. D9]
MSNHTTHSEEPAKRHKHEGPKKHIIAYVFSMLLTLVAFATVIGGEINTSFIYILLIIMAIMQVIIQMGFWMHMKDRGHLFPIVGILTGVFVVFTIVIMAEFWTWW